MKLVHESIDASFAILARDNPNFRWARTQTSIWCEVSPGRWQCIVTTDIHNRLILMEKGDRALAMDDEPFRLFMEPQFHQEASV